MIASVVGVLIALLAGEKIRKELLEKGRILPKGFVYVDQVAPGVMVDLRYFTTNNFLGARVDGYETDRCIVSRKAGEALAAAHADLQRYGYGLKIFDGYRPQRAVDHFVRWVKDANDDATRSVYYPDLSKDKLLGGYIAEKSGHSRGGAVDVTIVRMDPGAEPVDLDMGSRFDFFGKRSHSEDPEITPEQRLNRLLLRTLMEKHGFKHLPTEWWHFSLRKEPFPQTYFDFPVH